MSIRHAILGLLAEQPMHGYRLKEAFDQRVSPLWGLTTGQVYQTLAALERNALVECRNERRGKRPIRRIYSITESGRREIATWRQGPMGPWLRPFREELLIRLMMLREEDVPRLSRALERQEREATELLMRTRRLRDDRADPAHGVDLSRVFLEGMTHHLEADIRSLQGVRSEIERWAGRRQAAFAEGLPFDPGAARIDTRESE